MMQELPLNGFYSGESRKLTDRRCINWVPNSSDSGSLSSLSLMPTVGIEPITDIEDELWNDNFNNTNGEVLGQIHDGLSLFQASVQFHVGSTIVGMSRSAIRVRDLPVTIYNGGGTVSGNSRSSRFATDGTNLVSVAPSYANNFFDRVYTYDSDLNPTSIDIADALGSTNAGVSDIAYLGGRFLYLCSIGSTGFNRVHYSRIGEIVPNNLDFFAPSGNSERLEGLEVLGDRLYLFAETKTYIYAVSSSVDIPYQLVGTIEAGLSLSLNTNIKCKYNGGLAFYGKQKGETSKVYIMSGSSLQVISNKNIDRIVEEKITSSPFYDSSTMRLFSFSEKGKDFLCFRGIDFCFVYDSADGVWHERKTQGSDTWDFAGYFGTTSARIMVGSKFKERTNGKLFTGTGNQNESIGTELKTSANEDNPEGLVPREMISSPFNSKNDRIILAELQPQCSADFTVVDPLWPKPQINISVSYDFGNTFEKERSLSVGAIGDYKSTTRFFNFGYVDQAFTVKLRAMNPYPMSVIRLLARTEKGYS